MTPPIELPFVLNLLNGNLTVSFYSFLIILLSGKRSFLVAAIAVIWIFFFIVKKRFRVIKLFGIVILLLFFSVLSPFILLSENAAIQKYVFTVTTLLESDIDLSSDESFDIIDKVSGGRFLEISNSLQSFTSLDFILGKGPGYTYSHEIISADYEDSEYSNVHFTPVNLFSKYGVFFTSILFFYMLSPLFKKGGHDKLYTLFKLLLTMYLIEMLFAFNIFVEPLIPFCLGYLTHTPQKQIG
jgi:hypothetical protein